MDTIHFLGMISRTFPLVFVAASLLLAGCGGGTTLRYQAAINIDDASKNPILFQSIERVLVRRFAATQMKNPGVTVVPDDQSSATVIITLPDASDIPTAERIVTDPFTFDLRLDAGTEIIEGTEVTKWESTGIDGSMVDWVQATGNKVTSQVNLELSFDETGKAKLKDLTTTHRGKRLGIFVRDLLVSALTIESGSFTDLIIISGIPSAVVAEVFADDVNVGLHVTFTPL